MSAKTKKKSYIAPVVLSVFEDNLRKQRFNRVDDVLIGIQDRDPAETITKRDVPVEIPEIIRRQLIAMSRERAVLEANIEDILARLERIAEKVYDEKAEAEEAKKPHCKTCGQVLRKR